MAAEQYRAGLFIDLILSSLCINEGTEMYLKDGIIYGEQQVQSLRIIDVRVLPDRIYLITFNNGETRLFDTEKLSGPVFEPLKDPKVLAQPMVEHGVITWNNGEIDCSPEYMYEHSYEYSTMVV